MKKLFSTVVVVSSLVLVLFLLLPLAGGAAEKYPSKPITFIIPFGGGGMITNTIRFLAPMMEKELGVPFVVVEKPGAGGAVGWRIIQTEAPDGYTLGAATKTIFGATVNTKGKVDYQNFDPIALLTQDHFAVTVNAELPWKNLNDYIKSAKESPGKIRVGTSGTASLWHIAMLAFNKIAKVELTHIPFKSGGEAFVAVLGGHIESTFCGPADFPGVAESGKLRILAIGADKRDPFFPDVPLVKDSGIDLVMSNWRGVLGPKGIPRDRIAILEKAFAKVTQTAEYNEFMKTNRMNNDYLGPAEFRKVYFQDAETIINYTKTIAQ